MSVTFNYNIEMSTTQAISIVIGEEMFWRSKAALRFIAARPRVEGAARLNPHIPSSESYERDAFKADVGAAARLFRTSKAPLLN